MTCVSSLIDEGSGMVNKWGQQFALPGVAEKVIHVEA